jgi:hypothetical protein
MASSGVACKRHLLTHHTPLPHTAARHGQAAAAARRDVLAALARSGGSLDLLGYP